jgi:hypothetical protein
MEYKVYLNENNYIFWFNNLCGISSLNGNVLAEPIYETIWSFKSSNLLIFKRNGGWGIMDENGAELTAPLFNYEDVNNLKYNVGEYIIGNFNCINENYLISSNKIKIVL